MNLAVADMMIALFVTPRFILSQLFTHPDGMTGTFLCKLLTGGTLVWTGGASSVFTLIVIAFERYYAVMHPHRNKGKLTYSNVKVRQFPIDCQCKIKPSHRQKRQRITVSSFYKL